MKALSDGWDWIVDRIVGIAVVAGVFALIMLGVNACSAKAMEPFKDAPTSGHDNGPAQVIEMPDGFNNLATKCVRLNGQWVRFTVIFHGNDNRGSVAVTPGPNNGC